MALRSRQEFPPNGWVFHQAETGWDSNPWMSFEATVTAIAEHRKANKRFNLPTERDRVEFDLEQFTVARLRSMPGGDAWLLADAPDTPPPVFLQPQRRGGEVVAAVKRAVAGAGLIVEWLGDGMKPIPQREADARASVCVTCPQNKEPDRVQGSYSVAARGLHLLLDYLQDEKLHTKHDDKLRTCAACDCELRLKCWTPMPHILAHTSAEVRARLDGRCWVKA